MKKILFLLKYRKAILYLINNAAFYSYKDKGWNFEVFLPKKRQNLIDQIEQMLLENERNKKI